MNNFYLGNLAQIINFMSEIADPNNEVEINFEDYKNENEITFWWASDLCKMLGYKDVKTFQKVIDRAISACISANIPHYENFIFANRQINGNDEHDYKLTRFACFMCAMNGDVKKPEVAKAQVYFAEQTRKFQILLESPENIDRLIIRNEIKEGNKSLGSTATSAGVKDYARFANAGYMGMYNMLNVDLARKRKVDPKELLEHMGRTELAANLFRITQTEEKIKNTKAKGQYNLESTHRQVGQQVRKLIIENTGKPPEALPLDKKLPDVQKGLKDGYKKMKNVDKKKKGK